MLHLVTGVQWWIAAPMAFTIELRDIEPLPPDGAFAPVLSLGAAVSLAPAPRPPSADNGAHVWIVVGLGIAAMLLYLPRS